jgi:plastocyanin
MTAPRLPVYLVLVLLSCVPLLSAPGAEIRGHVFQPAVARRPDGRPSVGGLVAASHDAPNRRIAVVFLDAVPRQAFEALPRPRARMDQRREQFVPRVLAITVGTVVDFPNSDLFFHNVMSLAPGNAFDLGRYPRGQSRSVKFDTPGIVPVVCDIHAHMSAWVLVFSHPYFAVSDADGQYVLPGVPPGAHIVRVWSELGVAEARRITVGDTATVEVDFHVERPR